MTPSTAQQVARPEWVPDEAEWGRFFVATGGNGEAWAVLAQGERAEDLRTESAYLEDFAPPGDESFAEAVCDIGGGLLVWEGWLWFEKRFDGGEEVAWDGQWRRPTVEETALYLAGRFPW